MTDIVERLRDMATLRRQLNVTDISTAADEIERLEEENARLREALEERTEGYIPRITYNYWTPRRMESEKDEA